jgi:hypothetical protein
MDAFRSAYAKLALACVVSAIPLRRRAGKTNVEIIHTAA